MFFSVALQVTSSCFDFKLVASKYLYDDGEDEDVYNYDWSKAGDYVCILCIADHVLSMKICCSSVRQILMQVEC